MNIFYLHDIPFYCAAYHNDRHVVKMILETAQILCTAKHLNNQPALYRPTHIKHPCVIWAAKNKSNFNWLRELGIELSEEFKRRFNKVHKTYDTVLKDISDSGIPEGNFTPVPLAMPNQYKISTDPITSYRCYYIWGKSHLAKWSTSIPHWYSKDIDKYKCLPDT